MSITGSVVTQLVINAVLVTATACYLPRAIRRHKNRTFVITVLAMALFGLCVNLTGHTIEGWQEGFHIDKATR